jgi:hypothetical protein
MHVNRPSMPRWSCQVRGPGQLCTVLVMARAGAENQTAAQLDAVLGLDEPAQGAAITTIDAGIGRALAQATRVQSAMTIAAANETWEQQSVWTRTALRPRRQPHGHDGERCTGPGAVTRHRPAIPVLDFRDRHRRTAVPRRRAQSAELNPRRLKSVSCRAAIKTVVAPSRSTGSRVRRVVRTAAPVVLTATGLLLRCRDGA